MTSPHIKLGRIAYRLYETITGARQSIPVSQFTGQTGAEFDKQYGVDTSSDFTTYSIFGTCGDSCPPDAVRESLARLIHHQCGTPERSYFNCIDFSQFTFVDLGCGKGRAMIVASEFGFFCVEGCEYRPCLSVQTHGNLLKLDSPQFKFAWGVDAVDYLFAESPLVIFLFNPFKTPVLNQVLRNLVSHKKQNPEYPVFVIYEHPVYEKVFKKMDEFELIASTEHSRIYKVNV